jgi:hypothetical protein
MDPAGSFAARLGAESRRLRWLLALRSAATVFAPAALAALGVQALVPSLAASAWFAALLSSVAVGISRGLLEQGLDRRIARQWDESIASSAWASSAAAARCAPNHGRWDGLVLARADVTARSLNPMSPPIGLGPAATAGLSILTLAVAQLLLSPGSELASGPSPGGAGVSEPRAGATTEPPAPELASTSLLAQHVRLQIAVEPTVAHLGSELTLLTNGDHLVPPSTELPLRFFLVGTNGTLTPDLGFGPGFRVLPLPWTRRLTPTSEGRFTELLDLKLALQEMGLHERGLVSLFVAARTAETRYGMVRSNDVTIRLDDNIERAQSPVPSGQSSTKAPGTPKPEPDKPPPTSRTGDNKPESDSPDRLKEAKRQASAVRPLLAAGPTTEKEVSVFDSEAGAGKTTAPPSAAPVKIERSFDRFGEAAMPTLNLSPADRSLVAKYFEFLRRDG